MFKRDGQTLGELCEHVEMTRFGTMKHLGVLEDAGLVAVQKKGKEKLYTFAQEPLTELEQWIQEISAKWDERLLRLKSFIENE